MSGRLMELAGRGRRSRSGSSVRAALRNSRAVRLILHGSRGRETAALGTLLFRSVAAAGEGMLLDLRLDLLRSVGQKDSGV